MFSRNDARLSRARRRERRIALLARVALGLGGLLAVAGHASRLPPVLAAGGMALCAAGLLSLGARWQVNVPSAADRQMYGERLARRRELAFTWCALILGIGALLAAFDAQ